jgi:UDP-N-acetylmuramoylalanine--D-glutamate ligase
VVLADPLAIDLTGFAGVVVSPGVPLNRHPIAARARRRGAGDRRHRTVSQSRASAVAPVVAITGTNGKSTTTALTKHLLQQAGIPA